MLRAHVPSAPRSAPDATVGPFAYLRPGHRARRRAKVGTYVEIKNAEIGEGTKVPHLSYVGDATIGERTQHRRGDRLRQLRRRRTSTTPMIGDHVRIGSDNMLVAPVTIGDGAYTAAGSVITRTCRRARWASPAPGSATWQAGWHGGGRARRRPRQRRRGAPAGPRQR